MTLLAMSPPSIAQWLKHPTSILECHGFKSRWEPQKIGFPSTLTREHFFIY